MSEAWFTVQMYPVGKPNARTRRRPPARNDGTPSMVVDGEYFTLLSLTINTESNHKTVHDIYGSVGVTRGRASHEVKCRVPLNQTTSDLTLGNRVKLFAFRYCGEIITIKGIVTSAEFTRSLDYGKSFIEIEIEGQDP